MLFQNLLNWIKDLGTRAFLEQKAPGRILNVFQYTGIYSFNKFFLALI